MKVYNSLTQQKQDLVTIEPDVVKLYVCGMTVYDYCHIGHARVMVAFDLIARYLRAVGYRVHYVRNITDIDDKIIKRALDNGEEFSQLTERFIAAMHDDAVALGVLPPDEEPRATHHIDDIISMIEKLMANDFAYQADNGDIYYRAQKFEHYGQLSKRDLEQLQVGARVEVEQAKADPLDFVLWKVAKPGEPSWSSPWGEGRPGWHIECSAMSTQCLGNHFDIHGGGFDLIFPHHENEIAQSEAATGETFVNYWMHVGFVQVNQEKMSKSLNNFFTIREVLADFHPEVVRYFLLSSHYRSQINYSLENLNAATTALSRLYTSLRGLSLNDVTINDDDAYVKRFHLAMADDFNTPEAFAVLFDLARDINKARAKEDNAQATNLAAVLKYLGAIMGILQLSPNEFLQAKGQDGTTDDAMITQQIALREQARAAKNWAEADRIRDDLLSQGIVLEDGASGTIWRRQ